MLIEARVRTRARTGVEMEALTAVAAAALTLYDMLKAVDRGMVIGEIALWEKRGGRSGTWRAPRGGAEAPREGGGAPARRAGADAVEPRRADAIAAARARAVDSLSSLPAVTLPLARCAGRALRRDVVAPHALPPFRNSAMDGWAVRAADLALASAGSPVTLPVVGRDPRGDGRRARARRPARRCAS